MIWRKYHSRFDMCLAVISKGFAWIVRATIISGCRHSPNLYSKVILRCYPWSTSTSVFIRKLVPVVRLGQRQSFYRRPSHFTMRFSATILLCVFAAIISTHPVLPLVARSWRCRRRRRSWWRCWGSEAMGREKLPLTLPSMKAPRIVAMVKHRGPPTLQPPNSTTPAPGTGMEPYIRFLNPSPSSKCKLSPS